MPCCSFHTYCAVQQNTDASLHTMHMCKELQQPKLQQRIFEVPCRMNCGQHTQLLMCCCLQPWYSALEAMRYLLPEDQARERLAGQSWQVRGADICKPCKHACTYPKHRWQVLFGGAAAHACLQHCTTQQLSGVSKHCSRPGGMRCSCLIHVCCVRRSSCCDRLTGPLSCWRLMSRSMQTSWASSRWTLQAVSTPSPRYVQQCAILSNNWLH